MRTRTPALAAAPTLLGLLIVGCSQPPPGAGAGAGAAALAPAEASPEPPAAAEATPGTACWLLPAAKMSGILGEPLVAEPDEGASEYGFSSCAYFTRDGHDFRVTMSYEAEGGATKRMVMDIPPRGAPSAQNPYADLGDGATMAHGVLFIVDGKAAVSLDAGKLHDQDQHALAEGVLAAIAARRKG